MSTTHTITVYEKSNNPFQFVMSELEEFEWSRFYPLHKALIDITGRRGCPENIVGEHTILLKEDFLALKTLLPLRLNEENDGRYNYDFFDKMNKRMCEVILDLFDEYNDNLIIVYDCY